MTKLMTFETFAGCLQMVKKLLGMSVTAFGPGYFVTLHSRDMIVSISPNV